MWGVAVVYCFWVFWKPLTGSKDLFVAPAFIVLLQGPVEGGKLALGDQLGHNWLVPISLAGVDPLWNSKPKINSVIVIASS